MDTTRPTDTLTVILDGPRAAGVLAVGPYKPRVAYTLPREEAERLITAKGFRIATAALAANTED